MDPAQYEPKGGDSGGSPGGGGPYRGEKHDEKEEEKKQEKGENLDEKYRRDPVGFVGFTLVIIWLGVTLLLRQRVDAFEGDDGWAVFAWGVAAIFVVGALLRLAVPRWRQSVGGAFIVGVIAAGVGFGLWYDDWDFVWPVVIIAIGVGILAGRLLPRR